MIALDLHLHTFLIIYAIILLLIYIYKKRHKQIFHPYYYILILYLLLIFKITICPITYVRAEYRNIFSQENVLTSSIQLVPLKTFFNTIQSNTWIIQIVGNLLLFAPLPLLFSIREDTTYNSKKVFTIGLVISVSIEIIQFLIDIIGHFPTHVADIDDVIFNSLGIILGILLSKLMKRFGILKKLRTILITERT